MKHLPVVMVGVIIGAGGWYMSVWFGGEEEPRVLNKPNPEVVTEETGLPFVNETITEEDPLYIVDVQYPIFEKTLIDAQINAFITEEIDAFRDLATEDPGVVSEPYRLWITYEVIRNDDQVISVKFNDSFHTGGAHPNHVVQTFLFDTTRGSSIALEELFDDETYLERLSQISRDQLSNSQQLEEVDQAFITEGTEPTELNFSSFGVTDESLIIYFEPYQVAPYAYGEQQVEIPFAQAQIDKI